MNKNKYLYCFAFAMAALAPAFALAQDNYPARPVRVIVPLPPGTATDFIARTLSAPLGDHLKQQMVVDNRPGAGGLIGSSLGARATPDGYTLVMVAPPHTMSALLNAKPPYHPVKDFAPIAGIALVPNLLVVPPNFPAKSVKELVALLRANPGKYNYGSLGVGSLAHIGGELFNHAAGVKQVHVPFKALGDLFAEMVGERVHYVMLTVPSATPIVRDGRLRAIASSGTKRPSAWPDLPTFAESGLREATADGWFGLVGPKGTPATVVNKLSTDIGRLLAEPAMRAQLAKGGAEVPADTSAATFARLMQSEYERYVKLVKETGMKGQ
jgi:tripartite-type tricarboxylate transporter receptor subunit TctC